VPAHIRVVSTNGTAARLPCPLKTNPLGEIKMTKKIKSPTDLYLFYLASTEDLPALLLPDRSKKRTGRPVSVKARKQKKVKRRSRATAA
jgi:hypothetical protein